ncbi:MAG: rod shape-determining protein MreD [Elusimicrobia bacterium]|nr:rod shape-determining protein MreD [Elusimicrobiota bacterium]
MNARRLVLFLAFSMAWQWLWSTFLSFFGIFPNWLLVWTVLLALWRGPLAGECMGFCFGMVLDFLSPAFFGLNALALTGVGYGAGRLHRQMDIDPLGNQVALTGIVSLVFYVFWYFLQVLLWGKPLGGGWRLFLVLPVYNASVAPVAFWILTRFLSGKR